MRESLTSTRKPSWLKSGVLIALTLIIALLLPRQPSDAADYFILRAPTGGVTLTNLPPTASAIVLKHYDWPEVTDAQVAAAQRRDETFWLGLKLEQLAESYDRLTAALQTADRPSAPSFEVNQVNVNLAPAPRRLHHRHGRSR